LIVWYSVDTTLRPGLRSRAFRARYKRFGNISDEELERRLIKKFREKGWD
jgi:hypothetical protein